MFSFNSQINVDHLYNTCGDDVSFIKIMFETFLEDSLKYWDEIQEKLKAQKYGEILKPIHSIKPSFDMIGFPEVTVKVREYETFVKAGPSVSELLKRTSEMEIDVYRVKNILIEELKKMEAEGI